MKIVADNGNPEYFLIKVLEIIHTIKDCQYCSDAYQNGLRQSIGLLALALADAEERDANAKVKIKK